MSTEGSARSVLTALAANLGVAVAKFVAAAITGSVSLLAEGVHSVADSGNQVLLLVGGGVAVLVALVANGPVSALIVLGIIIAVMQLEGHVLQPLLLGREVELHPLAVVLAIAAGLVVAGIAGALFAVPLLAVLNSGIRSLRSAADEHVDPGDVHTSAPEETGPADPGLDRQPDLVADLAGN